MVVLRVCLSNRGKVCDKRVLVSCQSLTFSQMINVFAPQRSAMRLQREITTVNWSSILSQIAINPGARES